MAAGSTLSRGPPTVPTYDKFRMQQTPISKPVYNSTLNLPPYKAGGDLVRPKSAIGGRRIRPTYDNWKAGSHKEFKPIYGPQGDKRYHPYQNKAREEKAPKEPKRKVSWAGNNEGQRASPEQDKDDRAKSKHQQPQTKKPQKDEAAPRKAVVQERKPFNKDGPTVSNVPSYANSYDKYQIRATPMTVPQYKLAEGNKYQNGYARMQRESHPNFKPVYGPQADKRGMTDVRRDKDDRENEDKAMKQREAQEEKARREREAKEEKEREKEEKARREREAKGEKEREKDEKARRDREAREKAQEEKAEKEQEAKERKEREKEIKSQKEREAKEEKERIKEEKARRDKQGNEKPQEAEPNYYTEPREKKPFNKDTLEGPNVRNYKEDYDRKHQPRASPMTVPPYNLAEGDKRQKTYQNMAGTSHPDFHPVYGPQDKKRKIDILDGYTDPEKTDKARKEGEKEDKAKDREKKEEPPRKSVESPRREIKDSPRREEKRAVPPREQEKPVKKDDSKQPVLAELYQSKLKRKVEDPHQDKPPQKQEEVKPVPRREDKKDGQDVKKEERREEVKREEKKKEETPREQTKKEDKPKPREEPRKEEGKKAKATVQAEKKDPEDYRKRDESVPRKSKDEKDREKENRPPKEDTPKGDKRDPYDLGPFSQRENRPKEDKRDPYDLGKREEVKKAAAPRKDMKKEEARTQEGRTERKPRKKEEISQLQSSRDHERPKKALNNDTSLVRDGRPRDPQKTKPKAKVKPTPRDYYGDEDRGKPKRHKEIKRDEKSVRARYYEGADMDDVLQDKIATQLRENGIAETKVVPLSAKITQALRDDVIDADHSSNPQVTANLTEAINKHLDSILYNRENVTDLRESQRPRDTPHLSNLVLLRLGQVHEEIDLCKMSIDDPIKQRKKGGNTPREDAPADRSQIMAIKDGIEKQKTEKDIMKEKLAQARKVTEDVEEDKERTQQDIENLDSENWQLKRDVNDLQRDKQSLINKVREQQKDYDRLDKAHQDIRYENGKLKSKLNESETQAHAISNDLAKLQSENGRLKVLADQKEKEILHLRDPDKDMVHQIRILSDEVTMLRTQTRRLNEEKGLLKSRNQKMEATLGETQKQKQKATEEKDKLWQENQELKQRYRKLALANPQQRTLPDIMTGRNGPSSRATSRANSRAIRQSDDRRMSATREEDEDSYDR